jgi:hypothetical protein
MGIVKEMYIEMCEKDAISMDAQQKHIDDEY